MIANYHTHTTRCNHASGADREYVEAAVENGFQILGFSDHTPFPDYAKTGMHPAELAGYCESVRSLREEFRDKIQIHVGLEVEYDPETFHRLIPMLRQHGIEYIILAQHYVFGLTEGAVSEEKRFLMHCDQCYDALGTGLFTYWAHPDVFYYTGSERLYREQMRRLCRRAKEMHVPVEINLLGIRTFRHYPNPLFWQVAGEEGCDVVFGVDAHEPEAFADAYGPETARKMVEKYHLHYLSTVELKPLK